METKIDYYNRDKRFSYQASFYSWIGLALTLIYLLLFCSCTKIQDDLPACWDCEIYQNIHFIDNIAANEEYFRVVVVCGMTEPDIREFEKQESQNIWIGNMFIMNHCQCWRRKNIMKYEMSP